MCSIEEITDNIINKVAAEDTLEYIQAHPLLTAKHLCPMCQSPNQQKLTKLQCLLDEMKDKYMTLLHAPGKERDDYKLMYRSLLKNFQNLLVDQRKVLEKRARANGHYERTITNLRERVAQLEGIILDET